MLKPRILLVILVALVLASCGANQPTPTTEADPQGFIGPVQPTSVEQPAPTQVEEETPEPTPTTGPAFADYKVMRGDTLGIIADRYDANIDDIMQMNGMSNPNSLQIGQVLRIPVLVERVGPADKIIPDSELVYGTAYAHFDVNAFAQKYGGYLVGYTERVEGIVLTGPQIIQLVAERFSVGPRVLLTMLEMQGGWVTSSGFGQQQIDYPMGHIEPIRSGLYKQSFWMANALNAGYYGVVTGQRPTMQFKDRRRARFAPGVNPGTAAIQNALAADSTWESWQNLIGSGGFSATYRKLFGDPFAAAEDPVVPKGVQQPTMRLPFPDGHLWYLTGGPHAGWVDGSAWAALDFTPKDQAGSCWTSADWAIAAAPGKVLQTEKGRVVVNLSGSDFQGTGWTLLYMHMAAEDRVEIGTVLKTGDHVGHPSCEGGAAETSHLHFARLYNGQWIPAGDKKMPMLLSGWVTQAAQQEYDGKLVRGTQVIEADNAQVPDRNGLVADGGEQK
ncbi:MAG: LysM peptidoglycan-binding domain-containing protein [Rudaea sp.]